MRWPFGPPHMTLKPSKKNKKKKQNQKNKKEKKKTKKTRKNKKYSKMSFSVISENFLLFWLGVQNFPFLTTWPKKRAHKQHYKNSGFRAFFLESRCVSRNGRFWTKKPKIYKFQLPFFFAYFLLFQKQKTQKSAETPIFIVFLLT